MIPSGTEIIGDYAFASTTLLSEVYFSYGLKSIGNRAFMDCPLEGEVVLPNGLLHIRENAFNNNSSAGSKITAVTIPDSVNYIHEDAFKGCYGLIIRCNIGSYAAEYAEEHNFRREAILEEIDEHSELNSLNPIVIKSKIEVQKSVGIGRVNKLSLLSKKYSCS